MLFVEFPLNVLFVKLINVDTVFEELVLLNVFQCLRYIVQPSMHDVQIFVHIF